MEAPLPPDPDKEARLRQFAMRRTIFAAIVFAVSIAIFIYIVSVALGNIKTYQHLGAADVGLVVVAVVGVGVLLRPELFNRLTHLKVGGVELDLLQSSLEEQRHELDNVRFVLTLLLQQTELEHLKNLERGNTQYEGNHAVRSELRNLRTLGLIQKRQGRVIGEIKDNLKFDLKDIVELTKRGRSYLKRLGEVQEN